MPPPSPLPSLFFLSPPPPLLHSCSKNILALGFSQGDVSVGYTGVLFLSLEPSLEPSYLRFLFCLLFITSPQLPGHHPSCLCRLSWNECNSENVLGSSLQGVSFGRMTGVSSHSWPFPADGKNHRAQKKCLVVVLAPCRFEGWDLL